MENTKFNFIVRNGVIEDVPEIVRMQLTMAFETEEKHLS